MYKGPYGFINGKTLAASLKSGKDVAIIDVRGT